jgi:hypothetical protein
MRYAGKTLGDVIEKIQRLHTDKFTGVLRVQLEDGEIKFITIGDRILGIETPISEDR